VGEILPPLFFEKNLFKNTWIFHPSSAERSISISLAA